MREDSDDSLGHTSESDTGLIYMRARYYDPVVGRFVSEDPARDGANWFAYCADNPVNRVDPTGESVEEAVALIFMLAILVGLADTAANLHDRNPVLIHFARFVGSIDTLVAACMIGIKIVYADKRSPTSYALAGASLLVAGAMQAVILQQGMLVVALLMGQDCEQYHLPGE